MQVAAKTPLSSLDVKMNRSSREAPNSRTAKLSNLVDHETQRGRYRFFGNKRSWNVLNFGALECSAYHNVKTGIHTKFRTVLKK